MCCLCEKCSKAAALILLVLGVLFLLRDLNVWNFWNIQWWTVLLLFAGLAGFCSCGCPMCKTARKKK